MYNSPVHSGHVRFVATLACVALAGLLVFSFVAVPYSASASAIDTIKGGLNSVAKTVDLPYASTGNVTADTISTIIGKILKPVLGLLGTVFVALVIFAGFQWMTAMGNEEKSKGARDLIINAAIGLLIVVASYVILNFVMGLLTGI